MKAKVFHENRFSGIFEQFFANKSEISMVTRITRMAATETKQVISDIF